MIQPFGIATLLPDGTVLLAGSGESYNSAQLYDPDSETWTVTGRMIEARNGFSATLLPHGKVLVAGGNPTLGRVVSLDSAELFDPDSGTWTATRSMIGARLSYTATLLRMARCWWRAGATTAPPPAVERTSRPYWPRPSYTTRAAGPGPPPGT